MGSNLSYNSSYSYNQAMEERLKPKTRKQKRRRDSVNRPVLKLQICSNTMERQHKINGETSLDHPFLRRLSGKKYGIVDPLPSPPRCQSMNNITSPTSQSTRNTASFRANIAGIDTTNSIPRQNSIGEDSNSSTSMIVVQFVENEHLQLQQTPSPQYIGQQKPKTEYDHLCLVSYQRIDSNECEKRMDSPIQSPETETALDLPEIKQRILEHTNPNPDQSESQCTDNGIKRRLNSRASVTISRRLNRTTSLQSQLDEYMGVNIQLEVDEHDLSFGESVLKCLEEEGILMFDIDNPQSGSEKEISEIWPNLKQKMRKWKSQQSLLDLTQDNSN